jgi:hypothetical protein
MMMIKGTIMGDLQFLSLCSYIILTIIHQVWEMILSE